MIRIVIDEENNGKRLDTFLTEYFDSISRSSIQKHIKAGKVTIDRRCAKPSEGLKRGSIIECVEYKPPEREIVPQYLDFEVMHYDTSIIVVNKPSGLVVHPTPAKYKGTLVNGILYRFGKLPSVPDPQRPGIVHRLDRDTSGLMIVVRSEEAYYNLKEQFKNRTVEKTYFAVCKGIPRFSSWTINKPIGPSSSHWTRMVISSHGKEAVTQYEVSRTFNKYSLLKVQPKTGRTHQIRVHLASIGHPVLCDPLYGDGKGIMLSNKVVLSRLSLHSGELSFSHPETGKRMRFVCEIPENISKFLEIMDKDSS